MEIDSDAPEQPPAHRFFAAFRFGLALVRRVAFFFGVDFRFARSGSRRLPVSRFHSSKVSGEIFPSTSS